MNSLNYTERDYLNVNWRIIYKSRLSLNTADTNILETVYLSSNSYVNISSCRNQVILLYIALVKTLSQVYNEKGVTIEAEFLTILDIIARKQHRYHLNSSNYNSFIKQYGIIYLHLLRYSENILRGHNSYSHKANIDQEFNHIQVKGILQEKIFDYLEPVIPRLLEHLEPIDIQAEVELNSLNPTRWRNHIAQINPNLSDTFKEYQNLARLNYKNTSLDLLLFEIVRLTAPVKKETAIAYYFRHVYQTKVNKSREFKSLTGVIQKQLFKSPSELLRFNTRLQEFLVTTDLESTLEFAINFYKPVRKKILLDTEIVLQVEQAGNHIAERLSYYLEDEEQFGDLKSLPRKDLKVEALTDNIYCIKLNLMSFRLLKLFENNHFEMSEEEIIQFCKNEGTNSGVVINTINESCFDLIDDLLIELNQNTYIINPELYQQIINK